MDTLTTNLARLTGLAAERGLTLTPDLARRNQVAGLMSNNFDAVGEWICACKQTTRPAQAGVDICCPCPTLEAEIATTGSCHCRLFVKAP